MDNSAGCPCGTLIAVSQSSLTAVKSGGKSQILNKDKGSSLISDLNIIINAFSGKHSYRKNT